LITPPGTFRRTPGQQRPTSAVAVGQQVQVVSDQPGATQPARIRNGQWLLAAGGVLVLA
jgi:hypothetical protein